MKIVLRNTWIWNSVAALGVLALVGLPVCHTAAQSHGPAPAVPATNSAPAEAPAAAEQPPSHNWPHDVVEFGHNTVLPVGETANDMVVIGGSAIALGKVEQDIVAIFGNVMVGDEAGGDAVAVLGNLKLGTNAVVHGDTVAVLGNIKMGRCSR